MQQPASMLAVCGAGSGKGRRHPVFSVWLTVPFLDASLARYVQLGNRDSGCMGSPATSSPTVLCLYFSRAAGEAVREHLACISAAAGRVLFCSELSADAQDFPCACLLACPNMVAQGVTWMLGGSVDVATSGLTLERFD